jgi:PAS domain S-box-containing protein
MMDDDLSDFFDNAAIPMHWVDRDGVIVRVNRAELELLGYRAEEYIGRNLAEFHVDPAVARDILQRLADAEALRECPALLRCRDGSVRNVRITSNVKWESGEFIHTRCITRDVTDQARVQELGTQLADYLEGLFEGFLALDDDWRVTYVNAAAEQIIGRKRDELLGRTWQQAFPEAVGGPMEALYRRVLASRTAEQMELYYEHYGRWFEVNARPVHNGGIAVFFRDISDAKRRDEVQARLAAIVQSSDDAIISKSLDGVIQSWNAAAERVYGYSAAEAVGRSILLFIPPERHAEEQHILARLRAGQRVEHFDTVRLTKDGRHVEVSLTVSPVRDAHGRIIGASKVARDIGTRKQAERALAEANRNKDAFLAMLAHELRNPLAPIASALQLFGMVDPASTQAREARAIMQRQLEHLVRLVDDLMDVSRITRGKIDMRREAQSLNAILLSAVETARPAIEAGRHRFSISLPQEPLRVQADFVRLGQVVSNLLTNAAKYTDPGGQIALQAAAEGGSAVIRVRDNGIGIEPEMLPRVFDMFAQLEQGATRSKGGLGIGLALARALVQLHGGALEGYSRGPGTGAEFVVRLPLLASEAAMQPTPPQPRPTPARRRRVLVVDDNVDAAETLQMVVAQMGHQVEAAYDGRSALEAARRERPDVVLLDLSMPEMDGVQVARELRSAPACRNVRIVALSGLGQREDRRRSREAGFDDHLVKPVSPDELARVLA